MDEGERFALLAEAQSSNELSAPFGKRRARRKAKHIVDSPRHRGKEQGGDGDADTIRRDSMLVYSESQQDIRKVLGAAFQNCARVDGRIYEKEYYLLLGRLMHKLTPHLRKLSP